MRSITLLRRGSQRRAPSRSRRRGRPQPGALQSIVGTIQKTWQAADQTQLTIFGGALLLLFSSTLLGGASQTNSLSLMAVELASLPLLFVSLYLVFAGAAPPYARLPLVLVALIVAVPCLELIPLPYDLWTRLPGHGAEAQVLSVVNLGHIAAPFSLAPESAWRDALALAPPVAMFMGCLFLTDAQRRIMAGCWLALAVVSLSVGALQVLGGPDSRLYFYKISNVGSPIGLFSNRNHQAAFLYCLLPVAAIFAARFRGRLDGPRAFPGLLAVLYIFVAIAGVAATRSRAGLVLVGIALLGSAAVVMRSGALRRQWRAMAGVGFGGAIAVLAILILGLSPILERFGHAEERFVGWPIVLDAARSYLPLGSGIGSFETVYLSVEPLSEVSPIFFNHAHNDYLELWLETGVVGAALFGAFAIWFLWRCTLIWTRRDPAGSGQLAAACTLVALLLLAHSAVDFPLRTEALAVLFAFACSTVAVYRRADVGVATTTEPPRARIRVRRKERRELAPVTRSSRTAP